MAEDEKSKKYFTQKELANRWQCAQGTIINYRNKGIISFFQLPASTKVLYPVDEILELEKNNTIKKGGNNKPAVEVKRVKPCVSSQKLTELMDLDQKKASDSVEKLIEIMKSTLASGEEILISGFGKFSVNEKHERRGRNPATGEDKILPARKVVSFKSSGSLRGRVNGKKG